MQIIVNEKSHEVAQSLVSYEQVVELSGKHHGSRMRESAFGIRVPGTGPIFCVHCGQDLWGRTHASAVIAHALEECRSRLVEQRDAACAALKVLSAFARTAPGRLPQEVQDGLTIADRLNKK